MKIIDKLLFKIGVWLISRNKTMTAMSSMLLDRTRELRCDHCGLSPFHSLENCECKKPQKSDRKE